MNAIDVSADIEALHNREWTRLRTAGTWLTGTERVEVANAARGGEATTPAQRAAQRIHDAPASITREWLQQIEGDGLPLEEYVEVLGIVARLRALDTTLFGLGHPARPLPAALAGEPTYAITDAQIHGAWIPTVGVAFPPTILSSVPAENDAMFDVHGVLYLSADGDPTGNSMGNMGVIRDGVSRAQMEFVAARTSLLNDCFF